jgi:crotonobetainyl-CoA:carnitine CoA-transferase CaiB-like acyl-CoA transferase
MTPHALNSAPLAGIKVLDLTRLLPGPMASLHLADLGAEVIKIEDTGAGDYARSMGAGAARGQDSLFFRMINRNKKSLRLDLKQADGVAVFLRLVTDADVVLEGFRPGVTDKLGVGYAAVSTINPRIVYGSITGYGQDGPWAERAGHDINYIATSGVLDQIAAAGGPPAIPNLQIGDLLGGALTPLIGVLAALIGARVSGRGCHVDVAMTDAVFAHAVFPLVTTLMQGKPVPGGEDLLTGGFPAYSVYKTADGRFMAVGALEPKFWQELCRAIGREDLAPHGLAMGEKGDWARRELAALFAEHSLTHWSAMFENVDCCVTPVLRMDEAMAHPQLQARRMVQEVAGVRQFAPPFKFSGWQPEPPTSSPAMGADSETILRSAGYSDEEISGLRARRVI